MNDNYAVINGKRIKLTDEQVEALGVKVEKKRRNPFERATAHNEYYYIIAENQLDTYTDMSDAVDDRLYSVCNYFNDKSFANQVALHQLLYRKLLKFSYDNECEDTAEWNGYSYHFYIRYEYNDGVDESALKVAATVMNKSVNEVYFSSNDAAFRAIREVVEPFIEEHPEFVW